MVHDNAVCCTASDVVVYFGQTFVWHLQDVYKIGGIGTVPVGRVETGVIKVRIHDLYCAHIILQCEFIAVLDMQMSNALISASGFSQLDLMKPVLIPHACIYMDMQMLNDLVL